MTILVGMICTDGIVLAADSQETCLGGVNIKRLDFEKICPLLVTESATIVMAGSGQGAFISRAAEILETKLTRSSMIRSPREVADLAEDTLLEINRRYVTERALAMKIDISEIEKPSLSLLLGMVLKSKEQSPYSIFSVFPEGVAQKETGYAALGSGSPFAEYLLSRMYRTSINVVQGSLIAAYIIEQVKSVEPYCGGPTYISVIQSGKIFNPTRLQIDRFVEQGNSIDITFRLFWRVVYGDLEAVPEFNRVLEEVVAKAAANRASPGLENVTASSSAIREGQHEG